MAPIEDSFQYTNGGGGGVGLTLAGVPTPSAPVSNPPQELFDISALSGLKPSDKYLGRNRVSDIQEVYQSYLSGSAIGRGGKYITDAAKKYSVSFTEAARGYLLGAGLNIIPSATTNTTNQVTDTNTNTNIVQKNPFEILSDVFTKAFGNAVYNPPLQSQSYGYTPSDISTPVTQGSNGSIGIYIILAIVGIVGYFLYKRFAN